MDGCHYASSKKLKKYDVGAKNVVNEGRVQLILKGEMKKKQSSCKIFV